MKATLIFLPIMMTISVMVLAWSSGYGSILDSRMTVPIGVLGFCLLNLLLTIRSNYLVKFSRF